jgi:nucleoside-diphosphate-sugar epimerase
MRNQRILCTGGMGFIFSWVTEKLAKKNKVVVLDNLSSGATPELQEKWKDNKNIEVVIGDVNDIDKLNLGEFDYILHAAAQSDVDLSINEPDIFLRSNVLGTHAVLQFARKQTHLQRFIYT